MELKYFRITSNNGQEFVVKSEYDIMAKLENQRGEEGYISLKLQEGTPLRIFTSNLFSVQEVNTGIIGSQTRVWSLL